MVPALVIAWRTLRNEQVMCSWTFNKGTKKGNIFSNKLKISEGENNSSALQLQVQKTIIKSHPLQAFKKGSKTVKPLDQF